MNSGTLNHKQLTLNPKPVRVRKSAAGHALPRHLRAGRNATNFVQRTRCTPPQPYPQNPSPYAPLRRAVVVVVATNILHTTPHLDELWWRWWRYPARVYSIRCTVSVQRTHPTPRLIRAGHFKGVSCAQVPPPPPHLSKYFSLVIDLKPPRK